MLVRENAELRAQLNEAEETLRAIRTGEVDALVVESDSGPQIYTLRGLEAVSNQFRGEILAQISDAVVCLDNERRVTYLNAAAERQYGITASEALGRNVTELWKYEWLCPEDEAAAMAALRETGYWRGENIHTKRSGERIHVESSVICLYDDHGQQIGRLATIRDITERKNAELALRDAAERKDEFLAMLGHELRNPLTAIRHAVQIAHESPADAAACEWASQVIDRQSVQLSRMVDDLLDVARINRGRIELRTERIDLRAVFTQAIAVVHPFIQQRRHSFTIETTQGDFKVRGDAARLEQVLVNLLNNATKYTPEGGQIRLMARIENNEAIVSIADNGVGISPELLPHVFDLFRQADTALDRAQGGLGIGLTVVKSLVEMHGGRVAVESGGQVPGTVFTVWLPIANEPESTSAVVRPPPMPGAFPRTVRVVVVDDNVDAAEALARLLIRRNCEVRIAHDGSGGIDMAREYKPEVLLLDLGLPGLDGYELTSVLRADPAFASALFIAMSGYAQDGDRERSIAAGFAYHFAKPVDFNLLWSAMRSRCCRDEVGSA
jgi:PAS domain S-box-containing protein